MRTISQVLITFLISLCLYGQEQVESEEVNQDDLGEVTSDFKDKFFDALAQKSIGNHDLAIQLLEQCEQLQPKSGAVQFEIAKNYLANKAFAKAEQYGLKAIQLQGRNEWILDFLFEVYDQQKDYEKALPIMEELAIINPNYEEFLPSLYHRLGKLKEGIEVIEKLDRRLGKDARRTRIKNSIIAKQNGENQTNNSIAGLEQKIKQEPNNERHYINLIYLHSRNNNTNAIIDIAQRLENNIPNSDNAQLALYKIYFETNKIDKGLQSLEKILTSDQLDQETKMKVLNDYIKIANTNQAAASGMDKAIDWLSQDVENPAAFKAMGDYHLKKNAPQEALIFYEKGLELDRNNFDLNKSSILLSIDVKDFNKAAHLSAKAIEIYPAQPLLYLLHGVALNQLNKYDEAISTLQEGQAYLLDETQIESDILEQLAIAYEKKGDLKNASSHRKQSQELKKQ